MTAYLTAVPSKAIKNSFLEGTKPPVSIEAGSFYDYCFSLNSFNFFSI